MEKREKRRELKKKNNYTVFRQKKEVKNHCIRNNLFQTQELFSQVHFNNSTFNRINYNILKDNKH